MQHLDRKTRLGLCIEAELRDYQPSHFNKESSPILWMCIFTRFWNDLPTGHEDPRWNEIMHTLEGSRILATLLGKEKYWEKKRAAF